MAFKNSQIADTCNEIQDDLICILDDELEDYLVTYVCQVIVDRMHLLEERLLA